MGHSSPSSLPTTEEPSSSEHSEAACVGLRESFFNPTLPAMQLDAKFHILTTTNRLTNTSPLEKVIAAVSQSKCDEDLTGALKVSYSQ